MSSSLRSLLIVWVTLVGVRSFGAEDPALNDACLNDIFFIDANRGWAVGDRGVIWHTEDGGKSWNLQSSGTVCSLRSVSFVNEKIGWVAGGQSLPYTPTSSGLILGTSDGGRSWQPLSWQQYPRLHRVQFLNDRSGWAWGESSDLYPAGLFSTENAGRVWSPCAGSATIGWLAGHFFNSDTGVLAGPSGTSALVVQRSVRPLSVGTLGARAIRSLKFGNDGTAWAVGDGGLVLRSKNQAASWSAITTGPMDVHQAVFDWRSVHAIGNSVWIVGRPGSVVFHSSDAGATWNGFATGHATPLESVWFHDARRGWAAGSLGTIVQTTDGGKTWAVQRHGGQRAALLAVHADLNQTPLLTHVQLGADQAYLSVDLTMMKARRNWDDATAMDIESRLADAVVVAGGTRAEYEWRFPDNPVAHSLNHLLDDWNQRFEGKGLRELERRLALAIRMWRPEVIVTESPDPGDASSSQRRDAHANAAGALVSQALHRAFESAADPAAFPELGDVANLPPWSVKRLFTVNAAREAAIDAQTVAVVGTELARSTGKPLDDQANLALSLLADSYRQAASELRYKLAASRLADDRPTFSVMDGLAIEPGGPARRKLPAPVEIAAAARRAAETRRNLLAIIQRAETQPALSGQLTAQLDTWLKQLGPDQAGTILFGLARSHFNHGRWRESRELSEKLLGDYPNHLAGAETHRWLVQYYASSEARHRERLSSIASQNSIQPVASVPDVSETVTDNEAQQDAVRLSRQRQAAVVGDVTSDIAWAKGAVEAAQRLARTSPLAASHPSVQFPVACAQRTLGNVKDAERFFTTFSLGRELGPWAEAARSERWIRDREGMPLKSVMLAHRAAQPPHLDGSFDDPVWKQLGGNVLQNMDRNALETPDTQIRIAYDQQFLYVAISCYSNANREVSPQRPRSRDMDLREHDRVDLYFDLDRDYTTYYRLSVDERGCVFDDCWGDASWNPRWFVASQNDAQGYRIEAAIPLMELSDRPPQAGTVWAFNAVRVIPGKAILSWSRPADVTPRPEGMSYLFFTEGAVTPLPRAAVAN